MLESANTCNYCMDKGHMNHLNHKIACDLQKQGHTVAAKSSKDNITKPICQKIDSSDVNLSRGETVSGPDWNERTHNSRIDVFLWYKIQPECLCTGQIWCDAGGCGNMPQGIDGYRRKRIASLLDSGSQVTLIHQILPHIIPSGREKADVHQLFHLTAANNGKTPHVHVCWIRLDSFGDNDAKMWGFWSLRNQMSC